MRMVCIIYRFRFPGQRSIGKIGSGIAVLAALALCRPAFAVEQPGRFDYYVLALSWSPAYCNLQPNDRSQCGNRRFAFVLHGLWPQYRSGGYPEQCAAPRLPEPVLRRSLAIMPSEKLVAHEWRRHGSCSGLSPRDYFIQAERAFDAVRIPELFRADPIPQHLTAADITRAFARANPGLDENRIALRCSGPELEEVRICLTRGLAPVDCGRGVKTRCRRGPIQIRPVR